MSKKPVVLMVLDGYGISDKTEGNAIALRMDRWVTQKLVI